MLLPFICLYFSFCSALYPSPCVFSYLFPPSIFSMPSFLPLSISYTLSSLTFIYFMFISTVTLPSYVLHSLFLPFYTLPVFPLIYFFLFFSLSRSHVPFYICSFQAFFFITSLSLFQRRFHLSFFRILYFQVLILISSFKLFFLIQNLSIITV